MRYLVVVVGGTMVTLGVVQDELEQRHEGSERQPGHQYHERPADISDTQRMRLLLSLLLITAT